MTNVREAFTNEAQGIRFTFLTADALNDPMPTEHEDIGFFHPHELAGLAFCPADVDAARILCVEGVNHFLWDFDGTLADSYGLLTQNVLLTAERFGRQEDPTEILSMLKKSLPECIEVLSERYGITREAFRAEYDEVEAAGDLLTVTVIPGIPEVLHQLSERGAKHYIVTHRSRSSCEVILRNLGLMDCFEGMVTQEDPLPRKPAPDRCLYVLEKYGIQPCEAMMIGDRPLDITAGLGAGVLTLMLDADERFPDTDAHFRVTDIRQMLAP